jgi:electron transfer flavoprotein alpha subunit
MATGILIVGELASDGSLRPASLELVTAGRSLADALGGPLVALLMGAGSGEDQSAVLAGAGVDRVLVVEDDRFQVANAEAAASAVEAAVAASDAAIVLMPGTTAGRDYAPKLATRLGAPLAADCVAFALDGGDLVATRLVVGGRVQTDVRLTGAVQLATVRGASFAKAEATGSAAPVEPLSVAFRPGDFRVSVVHTEAKGGATGLDTADVVVAGGRGLKEPSNFGLVEDLASAFGGAVGATRAVVDAGWRPHEEQIGQTGRVVSPKLYVAVGVSGAVQHNVGMQGSGVVVAINRDPDAPIFKLAQFGIVGDLFEVLPALTREVKAARG